jgi:hypothetical protein
MFSLSQNTSPKRHKISELAPKPLIVNTANVKTRLSALI